MITKVGTIYSKHTGKMTEFNNVKFSKNVWTLSKRYMHIFNVPIRNVESLKNVSLEVSEELITQSRCHLFKKC
jgi:hypothetical protein